MRVGFNALHLVPGETGGLEVYARRLLPALLAQRPELRLTVFASREGAPALAAEPWAADHAVVRVPTNARSRPRRVLAEQTLLPVAAARAGVELLHNLFNTAPTVAPVPQVTTIHDLIHRRLPDAQAGHITRGLGVLVAVAARRSARVITVSEASRRDIVELLGVPAERIDVAPNGPGMAAPADAPAEDELRRRFELADAPLVLTASAKLGHKNLDRLIEAFGELEQRPAPVLLVPGYATPLERSLRERAGPGVRFTGWVDDATLEGLYRIATCFVFPSLAEGFGMPVLEAMARGVPVACSNATSLPEVVGDAALLFDPLDTRAIAGAIDRLLSDGELRRALSERGRARARLFTWERAARVTLASYDRALGRPDMLAR